MLWRSPTDRTVLLASGSAGGTIAAARHLAEAGIDVRVISRPSLSSAAWSRHVARTYSAPAESESSAFLNRLLAIGQADPGQILLPTSDETAWLYTQNAHLLERYFCLYQPSSSVMRRILDKKALAEAAADAGLSVLPSWDPSNVAELCRLAPTLSYPIIIKPRTHIHRVRNDKGIVVNSENELIHHYRRFVAREQFRTSELPVWPDARRPILQPFVRVGDEGVYSVTGFIDRSNELFVTRLSTKVFLRSRPLGVGVCFESLPNNSILSDAVKSLCHSLGYFGIFEVEFLRFGNDWAIIDFNPRLFHQIGMDIHRGMPLPLLASLDATNETALLRKIVLSAQTENETAKTVFCDYFTLHAILIALMVTRRISWKELAYWRAWVKQNTKSAVDVAVDYNDPMPGLIHALSEIYLGIRALPRFLGTPWNRAVSS